MCSWPQSLVFGNYRISFGSGSVISQGILMFRKGITQTKNSSFKNRGKTFVWTSTSLKYKKRIKSGYSRSETWTYGNTPKMEKSEEYIHFNNRPTEDSFSNLKLLTAE